MITPFGERLREAALRVGAPVAVGLDPHLDRYPRALQARFLGLQGAQRRAAAASAVRDFDAGAIDALTGRVAAIKVQLAFYEQLGSAGWAALEHTCQLACARGLLVIADGKRGDIASTAAAYADAILDPDGPLGADAVTVNPWMGFDTLEPFLDRCRRHGSGVFVLVRTTNPGSADLQRYGEPTAAARVAEAVHRLGEELRGPSGLSSVGAVVGAQVPADEQRALRAAMPDAWFLVPGVGAQGAGPSEALAGARSDGLGSLVVAARSVLFPDREDASYEEDFRAWIAARADALVASVRRAQAPLSRSS